MEEKLGIPNFVPAYIETTPNQEKLVEFLKIQQFLRRYAEKFAKIHILKSDEVDIQFINYGHTELVYVMTVKNQERLTLLVGQPALLYGTVQKEAQNLISLKRKDDTIVAPIDYFSDGLHELYVTPYISQARCVAAFNKEWGMYVPEPFYRFETFTPNQRKIVNSCMIAKLVSLFDDKTQEGLKSCHLGGGDFMLPKGWEDFEPSIQDTMSKLQLIAARDKIKCTFEDYVNLVRKEFSQITIDKKGFQINHRARAAMTEEEIETGIQIGIKIKETKTNFKE